MLSKDLTPNPKAVNIVRPSTQRQQQQRNPSLTDSSFSSSSTSSSAFMNLSSSTTSSINTLSTASTYNTLHIFTATNSFSPPKSSPMIRQLSVDSNPGLSFFCQLQPTTATSKQETTTKKSLITSSIYGPTHAPSSASSSSSLIDNDNSNTQKQQDKIKGPLVISRINLANFQHHQQQQQQQQQQRIRVPPPPIVTTAMNDKNNVKVTNEYQATNDELVHKHEDRDDIDIDIDIDVDDDDTTPTATATSATTTSAFKPGFGFLSNSSGGLGSFLLRGNLIAAQKPQVDEARIYRKLKDLEIEKKSLLQLNQTLEMVVKEQSNKISDLQNRLAA
ncbi:hypothetical protein BDF20DRAFT_89934 [Mycotypha africana]|uniref:uncharacterized protein n=1 Tax=Mycotypha africana TaxID=64632 RepID=UPI002301AC38|nr:uncharacterized protein BDF20DRAFT_89934 [Mycotypha africana]KAI8992139.1 hypothetical protein BDF20DRAFT_89934 [Mycotypha africana]